MIEMLSRLLCEDTTEAASSGAHQVALLAMDLAARMRSESALAENQSGYQALFEHMPEGFAYCRVLVYQGRLVDWIHLSVNSAFERLTGLHNTAGKRVTELIPGIQESNPELFEIYGRVATTGRPERFETFVPPLDRWLSISVHRPEENCFVAVFDDITLRMRAEEALRRSEETLRQAEAVSQTGSWYLDVPRNILEWSAEAYRIFGIAPGTPLDHETLLSYVHPVDRARVDAAWRAALEGAPYDFEHRILVDGEAKWVRERAEIRRDLSGRPLACLGTVQDITERKAAEDVHLRSQKLEALGTLAGGIAHQFNNALFAILGNTDLARGELAPEHPAQASLAAIERAGLRATSLVRQVLAFCQPLEQKRQLVVLYQLLEETTRLLRSILPAGIELRGDYADSPTSIVGDPAQIQLALVNLATNAADAIGTRGGRISVRLEQVEVRDDTASLGAALRAGAYVRLSVVDDGSGIDSATQARIFDPFFTTKPLGKGTGLGLSVVHGIMHSHGGAVTVESEPGAGATFNLYFPSGAVPAGARAGEDPWSFPAGAGPRVLFVDDEPELVELECRVLSRMGFRVTGCHEPRCALDVLRAHPQEFDVVVTDVAMPGMSGFDLVREIRALDPNLPIVMISGYVTPRDEEAARKLGVCALLLKPSTAEELGQAVATSISRARNERAIG